ncbi:hypothetical protein HY745_05255 [Candidatus Desantisbacteria bacterium]|nr:hypothetical protein [Candidatus Desantisbacteria bacterium]
MNISILRANPPEIHYVDPAVVPYGAASNITIIGKNFSENMDIVTLSQNMYLLSTWNAVQSIEDICLKDDYVFLACGIKGLVILQISDPFKPAKFVSSFSTNTSIHKVFVEENYAYITDDTKLYIIDINNITAPDIADKIILSSSPQVLFAKNGLVYLGYGKNGIQIINAANPHDIKVISQSASFPVYDIIIDGNYLLIASGNSGFTIFDNRVPEKPLLINTFKVTGFVRSLFKGNKFLYLACEKDGIQIFDISEKTNPEFILKIDINQEIKCVQKIGNYLYVMSDKEIFMIDLIKFNSPKLIKKWKASSNLNRIIGFNNYLYLIDSGGNFQILSGFWKIDDYKYIDNKMIVIMVSKQMPSDIYDIAVINNNTEENGSLNKAITVNKPVVKVSFIAPGSIVSGTHRDIIVIGQNFIPGAKIEIDGKLCANMEIFSQAKLKATYDGDLPVGSYDVKVINPDGQTAVLPKAFNVIEQKFSINNVEPGKINYDDHKRSLTIRGEKLNKTNKIILWGNGSYLVSNCDTPGNAISVLVAKNYCFVADQNSGLTVIDITNPVFPAIISNLDTPGSCDGISLYHTWGYLADGESGIQIVDVKYPDKPAIIWSCDTHGYAYGILLYKGHMYVADGKAGLAVFSFENQYNLLPVARAKTSGAIYSIAIKDNYIFVASGDVGMSKGEGIIVMDISDPVSPNTKAIFKTQGSANALQIVNNFLYVADGEGGFLIFDISNPENPALIGSFDLKVNLFNIFVDSNAEYAYITAGKKGLYIFDVKFPNNPFPLSSFKTSDNANGVFVKDNLAFIAGGKEGLSIVDISNNVNPMNINVLAKNSLTVDVACVGNYSYLVDHINGLVVVNTAGPRLKIESEQKLSGKGMDIEINNNYAYIASGEKGLIIFSLENPIKPELVSKLFLKANAYNVSIVKDTAYVSCVDDGVFIVNIKNPKNPVIIGSFKTNEKAYRTFADDKYAFVADYNAGLYIADISKSNNVKKISSINTKGYANDVIVRGKYAFVAASDMGLIVVDISDPQNPKIVSSCKTEGSANSIKIDRDIAALACTAYGVFFIDITNPLNPFVIGNYYTPGTSYNVHIADNKLYVADGNFGLNFFNMPIVIDKFTVLDENTVNFEVPVKLSPGTYNITLVNQKENSIAMKNNIFSIIKK